MPPAISVVSSSCVGRGPARGTVCSPRTRRGDVRRQPQGGSAGLRAGHVPLRGTVPGRRSPRRLRVLAVGSVAESGAGAAELRVTTFNILAPIYNRLKGVEGIQDGSLECEHAEQYLPRNQDIVRMLGEMKSDVVCLQEFWCQNEEVSSMYSRGLLPLGYNLYVTGRTNNKGDGLATLVNERVYKTVNMHPILFNDCANRVGQLLHLASKEDPSKEVIVINSHLVFPYNSNSTLIQLRETMKILEFLNAYLASQGKRLPVVICGDFNGTRTDSVGQFLESQGFMSAYDAHACEDEDDPCWVSHIHRDGSVQGVDFQWVLNPSTQVERPPSADWKAAVFAMVMTLVYEDLEIQTTERGYNFFATHSPSESICQWPMRLSDETPITREAFGRAIDALGLTGEGSIGLLENEIDQCYRSMDADGNLTIDYEEFVSKLDIDSFGDAYEKIKVAKQIDELDVWKFDRMQTAAVWGAEQTMATKAPPKLEDSQWELGVVHAALPEGMHTGNWAEEFDLSDHAPLHIEFKFKETMPETVDSAVTSSAVQQ